MAVTPKTELERIELTSQLTETLGADTARNLMAHITPINTEQLATKGDVSMVKNDVAMLKNDVATLKEDMSMVKDDVAMLKDDMATVKNDLTLVKKDLEMVETRLNTKIERLDNKLTTKIERLDTKVDAGFKEICSEMTLKYAQQSKKIFTIGLSLALPTWLALIGLMTGFV